MLLGYGGLNLPYNVPSNEYLTIEGKIIQQPELGGLGADYLSRYSPDPCATCFRLTCRKPAIPIFMKQFVRRNNDELVATYGSSWHRADFYLPQL